MGGGRGAGAGVADNPSRRRALPDVRTLYRKAIKALRLLREPEWRAALLRHGVAATVEHDRLPLRRDFACIIDVGANRGQFALYSRARFPGARVYALEPLARPRRRLERLFRGDDGVRIIAAAAGSSPGRARINVSRADDSSSLLPLTSLQTRRFPGTETVGFEDVEVRTLDDLFRDQDLARPLLLKLDVQGFELEALRGAERLLARVDAVLTECSFLPFYEGQPLFEDVLQFLAGLGFRLSAGAISSQQRGRWEQGDFLFER